MTENNLDRDLLTLEQTGLRYGYSRESCLKLLSSGTFSVVGLSGRGEIIIDASHSESFVRRRQPRGPQEYSDSTAQERRDAQKAYLIALLDADQGLDRDPALGPTGFARLTTAYVVDPIRWHGWHKPDCLFLPEFRNCEDKHFDPIHWPPILAEAREAAFTRGWRGDEREGPYVTVLPISSHSPAIAVGWIADHSMEDAERDVANAADLRDLRHRHARFVAVLTHGLLACVAGQAA